MYYVLEYTIYCFRTLALQGELSTHIRNEDTQPVIRAIRVSHTASLQRWVSTKISSISHLECIFYFPMLFSLRVLTCKKTWKMCAGDSKSQKTTHVVPWRPCQTPVMASNVCNIQGTIWVDYSEKKYIIRQLIFLLLTCNSETISRSTKLLVYPGRRTPCHI